MGLDLSQLKHVKNLGSKVIARCPACAEKGKDRKGEHLFIEAGGRFGYTGQNPAPGTTPPPAAAGGIRDIRDMAPATTTPPVTEQKPTPPPASTAPSAADMPYANSVPGNPLVVTLPGSNASLGQISIEKYDSSGKPTGEPLKRGTQVQIPDPNNPGKKIFFKVP